MPLFLPMKEMCCNWMLMNTFRWNNPQPFPKNSCRLINTRPQLLLLPDVSVAWHLSWLMGHFVHERHKQAENATNHRKQTKNKQRKNK